ncbi:MAG TPA: LCP family protein [Candidatus Limnocylindrales bacterium]|nr:LCP family protein [Candidatus Limnocylindrales bacterium]
MTNEPVAGVKPAGTGASGQATDDGLTDADRSYRWRRAIRRSAVIAAILSAVIPGLGQLWAGAPRRALVIAIPFLVLVIAAVVTGIAVVGGALPLDDLVGVLLRPEFLGAVIVVDVALLGYRAFAMADAWVVARRWGREPGRPLAGAVSLLLLVVLVAGNVAAHAGIAYLDMEIASAGETILAGNDPNDLLLPPDDPTLVDDPTLGDDPEPSATPTVEASPLTAAGGRQSPDPRPAPRSVDPAVVLADPPVPPPAWTRDRRLDVLLLGVDSGPGRWSLRTDTMILVSVDLETATAAMFGIPRNLVNVPLPKESAGSFPECRCYPRLLNSLYVYAMGHPSTFPGGDNRGFRAVAGAIETLTGVDLDGIAIVDLNGFVKLVNALGGLRITVPSAVYDQRYPKPDGTGNIELYIKAGRQKMNGFTALAYARSRHGSSDYSRMRRQQEVLVALRKQVKPCTVLADLPKFIKALKGTVTTTFKPEALPDLLRLAARVNIDRAARYSLAPPTYPEYLGKADWKRIRTLVRHVFDKARAKAATPDAAASPSPFILEPADPDDPCD